MEMMINLFNDDSDEDGEGAEIGGIHNMNISSACLKKYNGSVTVLYTPTKYLYGTGY